MWPADVDSLIALQQELADAAPESWRPRHSRLRIGGCCPTPLPDVGPAPAGHRVPALPKAHLHDPRRRDMPHVVSTGAGLTLPGRSGQTSAGKDWLFARDGRDRHWTRRSADVQLTVSLGHRGRDYADVWPLSGVYSGPAAAHLGVTVEIFVEWCSTPTSRHPSIDGMDVAVVAGGRRHPPVMVCVSGARGQGVVRALTPGAGHAPGCHDRMTPVG